MALHMGFGGSPDAAASVLDSIRAVGAAAQRQQQQFQQQSLKDQFEQELKLRKEGYTPYMQTTGQDASGLKRRDSQQVDPGRVISDPFGRKWVAPAPATDAPDPQKTFSDTAGLLEKGARPVDAGGNVDQNQQVPRYRMDESGNVSDTGMFGIHAAPPAGSTVTPPGSKQPYYVPPADETLATKLRTEAAGKTGTPAVDTEHFNVPVSIDHSTGKVTPLQLPGGVTHNGKADKPDKYTYNHFADDSGKVTLTRIGPDDATPEMWNGKAWTAMPGGAAISTKRKDPDAGPAPGEAKAQARRDAGQRQIEAFQTQEQQTHATRKSYADVVWGADGKEIPDGTPVIDPKSGQQVTMSAARRTAYKRQFANATDKVAELQSRQKAIVQRFGGDTGGSDMMQPAGEQPKSNDMMQRTGATSKADPLGLLGGK